MNPLISNLILMFAVNKLAGRLDLEDPQIINTVRITYLVSNLLIFVAYKYIERAINAKNDLTTFTMEKPAPPFSGQQPEKITTTVKAYDLEQVSAGIKGILQGMAMMAFMHLYMKYTNPLVLQSIMPLKSLYENKMFQIYVLGKTGPEFDRPFKVPSLFGDAAAAASAQTEKKEVSDAKAE